MKTISLRMKNLAVGAVCCVMAPGAYAVELTEAQLAELLSMKDRMVALELKVDRVTAEAEEAKAEAAAAKAEAAEAKAELAAVRSGGVGIGSGGSPGVGATSLDALDAQYTGTDPRNLAHAGALGWWNETSIGGYGEHHINTGDKNENDFHRWVLFINHQFDERLRLVTELELEHGVAGEGKNGEVELEQAYIEMDLDNGNFAKAGVFLVPVGILNEVHEPTTFFGVERNIVETEIIPSTWWEGGAAFTRQSDNGFQFDLAVHSGLMTPVEGNNAFRIRSGRQKVSEADGDSAAATTRVRYTGIPGLEVAGTVQWQDDISQSQGGTNSAWLGEGHINYQRGKFGLRALAGHWSIGGENAAAMGLDSQWGGYIEPSWTCDLPYGRGGYFARYSYIDAAIGEIEQYDAGFNFWPNDGVVLKIDYSRIVPMDGGDEQDIISAGLGYSF